MKVEMPNLGTDLKFFRIMFPGFTEKRLSLPGKIARALGERRDVKLRLVGGGGRLWDAKVVADEDHGGDMYLDHGWKQFARAHDLRDGHLLVFRHDGAGVLAVTVFDASTCRRDYPNAAAGGGGTRAGAGAGPGGSPATADADQSQFAVTLRPCNLGTKQDQYLHVPVYFQDAHGYARRRRVALRMGGRSWAVNLKRTKRPRGDRTAFKYGWHQFCVDNGLDAGDICFFRALGDGGDGGEEHVLKVEVRKKDGTLLA
ncbi:hypothetical protein ACP70R_013686 [Stipagrostis hirtigluma subsp. patula]